MNAVTPVPVTAPAETVFHFDGQPVRVFDIGGEPWIAATDLARDLGYREAHDLTRTLDEDEKGPHSVRTLGGVQTLTLVSEPGLYRALAQRRLVKTLAPATRERIARFQRWAYHEVFPSIRRTGGYAVPGSQPAAAVGLLEALKNPEALLAVAAYHAQQALAARAETEAEREAHAQTHEHLEDTTRLLDVASRRAENAGRALMVATNRIAEQAPIVERHRTMVEEDGAVSVTDAANVMGVPRGLLYEFLRDREGRVPWLYGGEEGKGPERPFGIRVRRKQMRVRLVRVTRHDGSVERVGQPLVTPKGIDRLLEVFPHWAAERARKAAGLPVDLFAPPEPPPEPEDA